MTEEQREKVEAGMIGKGRGGKGNREICMEKGMIKIWKTFNRIEKSPWGK